jgi:tryptophan synthase alpha subunit
MQRVRKGKEEEVKSLILEGFKKQEEGKLKEYMDKNAPKMIFLIRPECIPEVLKAAKDMKI